MWQDLVGTPKQYAGTSGTVTVGEGEILISLVVHASAGGASVAIFGGTAIPVINGAPPMEIRFNHTLWQASTLGGSVATGVTIVFTGTDSYFVHTVKQGNAAH